MLKKLVLVMIIAIGIGNISTTLAQTVGQLEVFVKSPNGQKGGTISDGDLVNVIYSLTLNNISNIKKLHVKLKDSETGTERFAEVIDFDINAVLPNGMTLRIKENSAYIGIGSHNNMSTYYASVQIEDNDGHLSDVISSTK